MAHQFEVDDSEWTEVMIINGYAVFMGYLMKGVRGLGILIVTWTTVVLLGGFVSVLGTKDFWCLTTITLIQTARVFNIGLRQTLVHFTRSWWGLLYSAYVSVTRSFIPDDDGENLYLHYCVALFLSGIQALVLIIALCPVAVLYVFGTYISAGVGLWRLIEHDFGNNGHDGAAHLKPALEVLYSLAVVQGVIYGYKTIHAFAAKSKIVEFSAGNKERVAAYLEDIMAGCEKDPSFATGRNYVTYAVDLLMDAKSKEGFINGVKFLSMCIVEHDEPCRKVLAKHLLTRPSSCCTHLMQRLLETLGPRSPYSGMIRVQAATILALIASSIHLEEHPGWIHCISSLLETFDEYSWRPEKYERYSRLPKDYERGWRLEEGEIECLLLDGKGTEPTDHSTTAEEGASSSLLSGNYTLMMGQGFSILEKLAVHLNNCRVIINTEGLLSKIMAPIISEELHRDQPGTWCAIARDSHKLVLQLARIPGEIGTKVRGEIARSSKAIITTLESILECLECEVALKTCALEIVLVLSVDTLSMKASGRRSGRIFNWLVLIIFLFSDEVTHSYDTRTENSSDTRRLAGEKLSSFQNLPLQESVSFILGDLTTALGGTEDISNRVDAAKILARLCSMYRKDDEFLNELKKAMAHMMKEVLKEILGRGTTGEAVMKAANSIRPSSQDVDMEMGGGVSGGGEGGEQASSSQQQIGDEIWDNKLQKALRQELMDLCKMVKKKHKCR